jgi:acetyl-CoA acetyltransferase
MRTFILGVALHPATLKEDALRLEEMVYYTSRAALKQAGVERSQLDTVTLGACDEIDGRPISSMLMTAPAGGYQTDEMKVTNSGLAALCLAYARTLSGSSQLGLVASWCKSSKTDVESVMGHRADPFYLRPLGVGGEIADALFSQAVRRKFEISDSEVAGRVVDACRRASRNPRGLMGAIPTIDEVAASPYGAFPLRAAFRPQLTDGAVVMVIASETFLAANPRCAPLAEITGAGWATDSYQLGAARLSSMNSAGQAWSQALRRAGVVSAKEIDVVELDCPTAYHEAAYVRAFELSEQSVISPSGGSFAQNPFFCNGLVNAAEAVLQIATLAGPVQQHGVTRAVAHGCDGYAQQGNAVVVFERPGVAP